MLDTIIVLSEYVEKYEYIIDYHKSDKLYYQIDKFPIEELR